MSPARKRINGVRLSLLSAALRESTVTLPTTYCGPSSTVMVMT